MTIVLKKGIVLASDKRLTPKEIRGIMRTIPKSMGNTGLINLTKVGGQRMVTVVREKVALKALEEAR